MEKVTLKLVDFLNLEAELNGTVNQQTRERMTKGLLQQPLPMGTKYWLTKLAKTVADEKTIIDGLRDELVRKHGKDLPDGGMTVELTVVELDEKGKPVMTEVALPDGSKMNKEKRVINPAFVEFEKDYNEVLNQEKELEFRPISLTDLTTQDNPNGIATDETYEVFFKHILKEPSE